MAIDARARAIGQRPGVVFAGGELVVGVATETDIRRSRSQQGWIGRLVALMAPQAGLVEDGCVGETGLAGKALVALGAKALFGAHDDDVLAPLNGPPGHRDVVALGALELGIRLVHGGQPGAGGGLAHGQPRSRLCGRLWRARQDPVDEEAIRPVATPRGTGRCQEQQGPEYGNRNP